MIRAIAILAGVLSLAGAPALAAVTYSPPEADFRILMPATPSAEVQPARSIDDASFRRYAAEAAEGAFALTVDRYPDSIRVPQATQSMYERMLWAHAKEKGLTLTGSRPVLLSKLPGAEGRFAAADGTVEVRRILMLGGRIYQLSYVAKPGASGSGEAFFASFQVLGSDGVYRSGPLA